MLVSGVQQSESVIYYPLFQILSPYMSLQNYRIFFSFKETKVTQLCLILCNLMDCNPPAFSVHGILQARRLECVAIRFSRGSSYPGIKPRSPTLQAGSFPSEPSDVTQFTAVTYDTRTEPVSTGAVGFLSSVSSPASCFSVSCHIFLFSHNMQQCLTSFLWCFLTLLILKRTGQFLCKIPLQGGVIQSLDSEYLIFRNIYDLICPSWYHLFRKNVFLFFIFA